MKELTTQIVVIAAGPSGLSAAVQAAEDGAEVIVIEKASNIGGAANMGMGPLGIGTKYQKQQMIDITVEKAFNMFMEYTHYQTDARLVKKYFEMSADTIEWLEDLGVEFEGAFKYFPKSEATWHIVKTGDAIGPRAASYMTKALYEKALELGVTVLLDTAAGKIEKQDGKVSAVYAVNKAGEEIKINCKAAIVCTGGAGASPEMIKEYTGFEFGKNMFNFAIPGITGDGLKMAWEAGAAKTQVRIEMAAMIGAGEEVNMGVANIFRQPNLLVNKFGKRVMNEEEMQNTTYLSNVVMHQKEQTCYSIVDSSIVKKYVKNGVDVVSLVHNNPDVSDFYEGMKNAQEHGMTSFFQADTLEELAEKAGLNVDNFLETVEDYNGFCDEVDTEFFKDKRYLKPIRKAPFYLGKVCGGGYGTVGGVKINENCEAIDEEFNPVLGLYCAGADSCNIYDDSYMFLLPGNSMGYAVNTGRIAGMSASEFVNK